MADASTTHNSALRPVMRLIVSLIGAKPVDLLIFAESLIVGIFLLIVKLGGDEPVLDVFAEGVRLRLAEQRLGPLEPPGHA
jgi:hypothetical protein